MTTVAAQIRAGLLRFSSLSDREILAASFRLCDAQELVARMRLAVDQVHQDGIARIAARLLEGSAGERRFEQQIVQRMPPHLLSDEGPVGGRQR